MGRYLVWALGLAAGTLLSAVPAAAQVDIGVWTPNGGGHVVLGAPRVYYPPPAPVYVYQPPPVYVVPYDHYYYPRHRGPRGLALGHLRKQARYARPYYYGYPAYSARAYDIDRHAGPYYRSDRNYRSGGRDRGRRR